MSEYTDRPTKKIFRKVNDISEKILAIDDKYLNEKNKIVKYSSLASLSLLEANFSMKINNKQSLRYAKAALKFGMKAEGIIKDYGVGSEFIKGGSADGSKNKYDTVLFIMIHANAIIYCNGNEESLLKANDLLEKISSDFFDEKRTNNDLCLDKILQPATQE